jgi:hypothetical protein
VLLTLTKVFMIRVTAVLVLAASVVMCRDDTVITGGVKDCSLTTVHPIPNVTVRTFDVATNRKMLNVLLAIDSIGSPLVDTGVPARMESLYRQLVGFLGSATPLAIDTSNSSGDFTLRFARTDSVFVVGFGVMEDVAYYFSYKVLGGRTSTAFVLDMSRGSCGLEAAQDETVLTGNAKDCFQTTVHPVQDLIVRAFDVATNRQMLNVLVATDSIGTFEADPTAGPRQDSLYARLLDFLGSATPLAVDTSNSTGEFVLRFPPTDTVIVVGIKEREDEPYFFSYKVLGARTSTAFVLDMSSGQCGLLAAERTVLSGTGSIDSGIDSNRRSWGRQSIPGNSLSAPRTNTYRELGYRLPAQSSA